MSVEIVAPGQALGEKLTTAARVIFEVLGQRPKIERLTIGLCGGRSVVGLLGAFLTESKNQPRDILSRLELFMVDERIVPLNDPHSNFGGLKSLLFDELLRDGLLKESQLHPFEATHENAAAQCARYGEELEVCGGRFSVVVLGMGEDGHIAGLFPAHPLLKEQARAFVPFFDSPKLPTARMTASPGLVCSAELGVLLALGESKRDAWRNFCLDGVSVEQCPAAMVRALSRAIVITDLEA